MLQRFRYVQVIIRSALFFVLVLFHIKSIAQRNGRNYPHFEYKDFHFGTMLGTTISTYSYKLNEPGLVTDSIQSIAFNKMPGMAIHIPVVSWNPHPVFNLRIVPSISFHETEIVYNYISRGKLTSRSTRTQPTLLNFPLLIKLNTKRLNNFSAYAITGFSYSLDLASQKDVLPNEADPILKLSQHDFAYHVGGGFDFYLPYFKFGIDIKLTNGINNLLIQDNTFFSNPLSGIRSQTWWFSITFEG